MVTAANRLHCSVIAVQWGAPLLYAIQLDPEHGRRQQPGGDEVAVRH